MESKLTSCCYIVLQALVLVTSSPETDFGCRLQCPLQNRTQDILYEVGCGADCKITQCLKGCSLWQKALEASCQTVCNGTQELLPPKELYCVMGCNDALNRYLQHLKEELGTPPPPALVADTLTATSLKLEWDRTPYPELTAVMQWAIASDEYDQEEVEDLEQHATWQYANNQSWDSPGQVLVGGLRPYTNYKFRVTLLAQESELTSSESSLVIGTLPAGLPSSPPSLLRAAATDPTRVSVSWSPGIAPNGPILSYVVSIDELSIGYKAHKDIPATDRKEFYIFQGLLPSRNYTVSVAMRNAVGVGPPETTIVTTPSLSHVKGFEKTILILGAHHSVFSQAADMSDEPVIMYRTKERIRGVAVHLRKGLLFVSDSTGRILVTSARNRLYPHSVLIENQGEEFVPYSLSVDWLNDQLYILAQVPNNRWQVMRCELDGSGMTVAVAGLLDRPLHIEVDPYNGYLFWVMEGTSRGGLYRLDTAHISNGIKHEIKPDLILPSPDLGAFTVDHTNFRILVSSHAKNTVLAVSLDGKEVTDLRHNTQSPQFTKVLSLTMANGLLYWTNGELILTEEYHNGKDSYFHNVIVPDSSDPGYVSIGVDLPSAQPVPSPINPPTGIQAVMGAGHVRASWNIPHLLGGQGKGAWQNWSYQISVENIDTGDVKLLKDINDTRAFVGELEPASEYRIKCAATTIAGVGPWSGQFVGRTLSQRGNAARLVWGSTTAGLVVSDPAAESMSTYLFREHFQDNRGAVEHITDIAWHKDILYLVTNSSRVMWYNSTTREHGRLPQVSSVGSIAVDWVGKKLYWSSPKQQLLTRGSLNGSDQEPLPILTVAKELNIDSEGAYIYWSTGHAVECARLNGKQRRVYYPAELFSGKQVMGLTLDSGSRTVYWVVRNYEGSTLFKAGMLDSSNREIAIKKITLLQNHDILGPLVYLDERLFWVRDDRQAVIGDLSGSNSALLASPSLTDLSVLTVVDHSIHNLSNFLGDLEPCAIPQAVDASSLKVIGNHSNFNLSWDPVTNVNVGQVFYELKVSPPHRKEIIIEITEPTWSFPKDDIPPPYSQLDVTLRALTYWGGSSIISARLFSPQTSPSAPSQPRVYVNVFPSRETEVVFRWDPPTSPNGLIIGYSVVCWLDGSDSFLCNARDLGPNELSLVTREVPFNVTSFFQVRACTVSGCGPTSRAVIARTDKPSPVPRLLMFTNNSLSLVDADRGTNVTIAHLSSPSHLFAYSPQAIYWLDESSQVIVRSHPHSTIKQRIVTLNGTGTGLAVDWVANILYWSEMSATSGETDIKCLDLSYYDGTMKLKIRTIFSKPHPIITVQVNPAQSMIYWYEEYSNRSSALWKGSMNGQYQQPFFGHSRGKRRWGRGLCSCPDDPRPSPVFAIDHLSSALVWNDLTTRRLVASDLEGCGCTILLDSSSHNSSGLPPTSLTTDQDTIYWSNSSDGLVYSISKIDLENYAPLHIRKVEVKEVGMISAFGNHLLPYPDLKCLLPAQPAHPPVLLDKSSSSVVVRLMASEPSHSCSNVSRPSSKFTIFYNLADTNCSTDTTECLSVVTMDSIYEINELTPYSNYVFLVAESNAIADKSGIRPEPSLLMVFQTAAGAPSSPESVEVHVLSPITMLISWDPPVLMNSESVFYEVHWTSEELVEGARQKGEQKVEATASESSLSPEPGGISTRVFRLTPSASYLVWVRAYSQNGEAYSESPHVEVRMFPEPNNLTLINSTAYSLELLWQRDPELPYVRHDLEYVDGSSGDWGFLNPVNTTDDGSYQYLMEDLKPRTVYTFRLKIVYVDLTVIFFWPMDNRFTFKTLGDRPSRPGPPVIHHLSGDVAQVAWDPSKDNGSPVAYYQLEGMKDSGRDRRGANYSLSSYGEPWALYYQGSDNFWMLSSLDLTERYRFRVRALNDYGWSEFSESSGSFDLTRAALLHQEITIILWVLTPVAIILTILLFMCVLYRHEKTKKWGCGPGSVPPITSGRDKGPDVELATLRQIPRWSAHIQSSNVLYTAGNLAPVDLLPHLRRDQITLTKFLGSGAFGEVFEGIARALPDSSKEVTRVAVKTLRKGANDNEKAEFLKEAQLMSNFRHPHILQLLGVCLDNDPHFIIMELMEGGDLLSYLRASRPLLKTDEGLRLLDLVSMCVDVARGCCYLEEMHFVHRDLACRNCLVSSRNRSERLVKIGDFGLARDIYKNDYYRKEGEGLLPVRWMAPESLVDGVFTSQSDVWSFGVLLWEIMSLGQQPYPARNNLEVLHYVRTGGRLGQPVNSDADLYELMIKCWSFNPAERPTFKYCLEVLEDVLSHTENVSLTTSGLPNGITRNSSDSKPTASGVPKYLELLYDTTAPINTGEGYEVPRSLEEEPGLTRTTLPRTAHLPDFEEASRLLPPSPTSPSPS